MMCVLPLLSGGISSWRQGRGNPLRHTTTHTDTEVSLDSPSSSTTATTTSMPLGLLRLLLFIYPSPHPPPSLPRPGRLSSALSLLFIVFFPLVFCFFHLSAVSFSRPHFFSSCLSNFEECVKNKTHLSSTRVITWLITYTRHIFF